MGESFVGICWLFIITKTVQSKGLSSDTSVPVIFYRIINTLVFTGIHCKSWVALYHQILKKFCQPGMCLEWWGKCNPPGLMCQSDPKYISFKKIVKNPARVFGYFNAYCFICSKCNTAKQETVPSTLSRWEGVYCWSFERWLRRLVTFLCLRWNCQQEVETVKGLRWGRDGNSTPSLGLLIPVQVAKPQRKVWLMISDKWLVVLFKLLPLTRNPHQRIKRRF